MMGCEGGVVTNDNLEALALLEDELSYPPRFRLQFKAKKGMDESQSQKVTVKFNGVNPSTTATVILEKSGMLIAMCFTVLI